MKIYHNPRCTKSRQTLDLLKENGVDPEIVLYLENPPTAKELSSILKKLDINAEALLRKGEAVYKEKFKGLKLTEKEWIDAMVEYPKLIERPIVIKDKVAVIGRPPELVLQLLD